MHIYTFKIKEAHRAMTSKKIDIRKLVYLAVLTALVIVLQLLCSFIKTGVFQLTLALVPIAIGAILCGPAGGAWLGFVFGLVVLLDGDAAPFMAVSIPATIIVVLLKGALCGFAAGLIYKAISKAHPVIASYAAAIVCPIVNTGVFVLGCYAFFFNTLTSWAGANSYDNTTKYIFIGMIGINFFLEMLVSVALSPVVARIVCLVRNKKKS